MPSSPKNYLFLPGLSGNIASTPNASQLQLSTRLDAIFRIKPLTWKFNENRVIFSKYDTSGNNRGYQLQLLTTGVLRLTLSQAGSAGVDSDSSVSLSTLTLVNPIWLRVTYRASDGRVQFFYADDSLDVPTIWTQIGIDKTNSVTSIFASTTSLRIGANTGTTAPIATNFYNLIIKDAIDGNTVFAVDFTKQEVDTVLITEDSSYAAVVTITATEIPYYARIAGPFRTFNTQPFEYRTNAGVRTQSPPSITKTATPFDGNKACTSTGLHTPIWSTTNNIYIIEPYSDNTTHATRLNTSLVSQQNVVVNSETLNSDPGHRGCAIAVDSNGTILAYPSNHNGGWQGKHSTSSEDLATLTATISPVDSQNNSYRRYFRNPNDGSIWMTERGYGYYGYLRKWNNTTKTWITKPNSLPISGWGNRFANSIYGMELAFSNSAIYLLLEWSDGGTGYPRRDINVIKSTDNGDNWTDLTGSPITTPLVPNGSHNALPSPNAFRNVVQARLAIDNNGNPVVIAAYQRYGDTIRSLYVSRWVPQMHRFEYRKVVNGLSATDIGNVSVTYYNGIIYALFSQYDEHDDAMWSTNNPTTPWARAAALYLLTTSDGGVTFDSYTLDDGTNTDKWYGGYFDPEALRLHSKIRILPTCGSDFSKSQIWEFTI